MISWHRFYDPDTGRYISADPIGLDGGMNLYAYVQGDPINKIDFNGLRARVCCKNINAIGFTGASHCYIEREKNGKRDTWGLFGNTRGPFSDYGEVSPNDGYDRKGSCGPWKEDNVCCPGCVDDCVEAAANAYPKKSNYSFASGPNSNTFAGTVARKCGLSKPDAWAPGWDDSPATPYEPPATSPPTRPSTGNSDK